MNPLETGEEALKKLERIEQFGSTFEIYPFTEARNLVGELDRIADSIDEIPQPSNQEELINAELKRQVHGAARNLEQRLSGRSYPFETVTAIYNIPPEDIADLGSWLENHREKALDASERLFRTSKIDQYRLSLSLDVPDVRRQAEAFAATNIQRFHNKVGKALQHLTEAGEFLRDITAVPTNQNRSYFNSITGMLALSIPQFCFMEEDGSLGLHQRKLIGLYGHEGMGHALNHVITRASELPRFLRRSSNIVTGTMESIAQFYQHVIFEDLKDSPEVQKELDIQHVFPSIYQEAHDIRILEDYKQKLFQYAITVLADKSHGEGTDPQAVERRVSLLEEVTLDPAYPRNIVEQNRYNYDSEGNLAASLASEIRYVARPVQRSLETFAKAGKPYGDNRTLIDLSLLTGLWTPQGLEQKARLDAQ